MVEQKKSEKLEREYVIPLRRAWKNVVEYKRSRKAVKTIKIFIAKHMKVENRDLDKVKLDVYLNNDIWFQGRRSPPSRVKVKAVKENGIVHVKYAETPQYVKFLQLKHSKIHKQAEKKAENKPGTKSDVKPEERNETQTPEQKIDEKEKGKAIEQESIKQADAQAKAVKHTTKPKEQKIQRMALKK